MAVELAFPNDSRAIHAPTAISDGADIAELIVLRENRPLSRSELQHTILRGAGSTVGDEEADSYTSDIFDRIDERSQKLASRYPFALRRGQPLRQGDWNDAHVPYAFLLAISNHSMKTSERKINNLDPTRLFERLCRYAASSYVCPETSADSCSVILGSARGDEHKGKDFRAILNHFLTSIGSTDRYTKNVAQPRGGDGGIDIACWRRLPPDEAPGAICLFAQCKTGQHWHSDLHKSTDPQNFLNRFSAGVADNPVPVPAYMVPVCIEDAATWADYSRRGRALLFDRVRIAQITEGVPPPLLKEVQTWTQEAIGR